MNILVLFSVYLQAIMDRQQLTLIGKLGWQIGNIYKRWGSDFVLTKGSEYSELLGKFMSEGENNIVSFGPFSSLRTIWFRQLVGSTAGSIVKQYVLRVIPD